MKEWILYKKEVQDQHIQFNWKFDGELNLDLVLMGPPNEGLGRPYFEMARLIDSERLVDMLDADSPEYAREALREGSSYCDCFWIDRSIEKLEDFCRESRLPLPEKYLEAWNIAQKSK